MISDSGETMMQVERHGYRMILQVGVIGVGAVAFAFSQCAAPARANAAAQQAAATAAGQGEPCAAIGDEEIPITATIRAKVTNMIDAAHLKPGKKIWLNSAIGMVYPGCTLDQDAAIYGTVTSAASSKNPNASELSLEFNSADCTGHSKQPLKLLVVGVMAPPDQLKNSHDAMPTELQGSARQISDTAANTDGYDAKRNPGSSHAVHPGVVLGFKNVKLEPQGGPQCSAKLTSTERNIELAPGAILLMVVPETK
jgi:hypothetical protein